MENFYEIAFVALLGLVCLGGLILLITASARYGVHPLWWIVSLILGFIPGYTAYFASRKKYLEKNGASPEAIKAVKLRTNISLLYIIATWILLAIVCAMVIVYARDNPGHSTYGIQSLFFWALAGTTVIYMILLLLVRPSRAGQGTL